MQLASSQNPSSKSSVRPTRMPLSPSHPSGISRDPSTTNPGRSSEKCKPEPFMGTRPQAHGGPSRVLAYDCHCSPPECVQIHCGGLGGGALGGSDAPTFDCTNPRVDGTCVYGPSLAPVDRPGEKITGVAAGATTCLHELAMLMSLTVQPCTRWQELGFGQASILYRSCLLYTSPSPRDA